MFALDRAVTEFQIAHGYPFQQGPHTVGMIARQLQPCWDNKLRSAAKQLINLPFRLLECPFNFGVREHLEVGLGRGR